MKMCTIRCEQLIIDKTFYERRSARLGKGRLHLSLTEHFDLVQHYFEHWRNTYISKEYEASVYIYRRPCSPATDTFGSVHCFPCGVNGLVIHQF